MPVDATVNIQVFSTYIGVVHENILNAIKNMFFFSFVKKEAMQEKIRRRAKKIIFFFSSGFNV